MSLTVALVVALAFQSNSQWVAAPVAGYKLPPAEIVDLLDARPTPAARFSPDGKWIALLGKPAMPSIESVTRPWIGLAGLRIDPALKAGKSDDFIDEVVLRDLAGAVTKTIDFGVKPLRLMDLSWSHTNDRFFATLNLGDRVELVTYELATGKVRRCDRVLSSVFVRPRWMPDGKTVLCAVRFAKDGPMPPKPAAPIAPSIEETEGSTSPVRTYQDLLKTPYDEELFDYFATVQLAAFDSGSGATTTLGAPTRIAGADASPDGQHLLVSTFDRPYTYLQPANAFGRTYSVWDKTGKIEKVIATIPLEENVPIEGVTIGPRQIRWQSSADATLVWWEALDGGDPKKKAEFRDRLMVLAAPFTGDAREALRVEHRAQGLQWFSDPNVVAATDYDRDRRWTRTRLFDLKTGKSTLTLDDRNRNDRYNNPGMLVTDENARGERLVRQDGSFVYRQGDGDSKEGARPFLDRFDLATGKSERLWRCAEKTYESVTEILASAVDRKPTIVTSFEATEIVPNYVLRDLETGVEKQLTDFPDPQPALRGITKELVTYKRADGVDLSATLYLPKGYTSGRLPVLVWAYPLEYTDPATAGQISGSPHRFVRVGGASHLLLLTQGYAILDNATMPIVGDPETMNDTFVEQIVSSTHASIAITSRSAATATARS
jgi:dipeptidyl aminopeptidase/acylaminoacyl peptidase